MLVIHSVWGCFDVGEGERSGTDTFTFSCFDFASLCVCSVIIL